jgi:hypothetical protein
MIRYLRHADIDKAEWDRKLLASPNKLWYALSHVLDVASPGWEALVDDVNDAMMPLTQRKKFGFRYLFQPFGLQQLGVFSPQPITTRISSLFLEAVPKHFRLAEISVNQGMPTPQASGWASTEHTDSVLDLSGGIPNVRANYSNGHARNLLKARERLAARVHSMDPQSFADLYLRSTAQRFKNIDAQGLRSMAALLQAANDHGEVDIIGIRDEQGTWRAGVAFVHWQERTILLKSASDDAGRGMNAMFHLVDVGLQHACAVSALMDFAGSEHQGTARFYEGFGAKPTVYLRLTKNDLPFWVKPFKR